MVSFKDYQPICREYFCLVTSPCKDVPYLEDFGIVLGSLNDTLKSDVTQAEDETVNIRYRGSHEIERHKAAPQFFKIPFESYLANGQNIGLQRDVCYLTITGYIPDGVNQAILGQPFLQNYYTVLNQDTMEIGLGAHIGMDAKIQKNQFSQITFMVGFLITVTFIVMFVGIGIYTWKYYKQRKVQPEI